MTGLRVIGIDPGPTPGVCVLDIDGDALAHCGVLQCSESLLYDLVPLMLHATPRRPVVAVERFVVRGRATAEQRRTREQADNLAAAYAGSLFLRSASEVKPWATDARLQAAGLLEACTGMRHARDAARHALFAAVKDGGLPDPLSGRWRS